MNHIDDAAHAYASKMFNSPKVKKQTYNKPPNNTLQCCKCGKQHAFPDGVDYEELSACADDDCIGQCFCNKWDGWEDSKIVSV